MSDQLRNAALGYAAAGLPVLPLEPSGKRPLGGNGKDHATTDRDTIAEWWSRWPHANVGVRPLAGLVVLDVDPRHGGADTIAELQQRHDILPPTLTAETGSGGWHIWLAYTGPTRGRIADGVDVKTTTGYLVAPPSVHECGGTYRWVDQSPTAPAPQWVRVLLAPPMPTPGRLILARAGGHSGLVRSVARAQPGNRNAALHWAACRAWEAGGDAAQLAELADAARSIGLGDGEIEATINSAGRTVGVIA